MWNEMVEEWDGARLFYAIIPVHCRYVLMKAELVKLKNCTSACLNLRYALTSENYRTS